MKRQTLFFLIALVVLSARADVWNGADIDATWYNEEQNEFHIYTASELRGLSELVNAGFTFDEKTIYLEDDIDLNNKQWMPIGFGNTSFSGGTFNGTFIGNNHMVSNIYIDSSQLPNPAGVVTIGLFGNVKGVVSSVKVTATIDFKYPENVVADNVQYMGGIMAKGGSIDHCSCYTTYNFYRSGDSFTYSGLVAGEVEKAEYCKADGAVNYWGNYNAYMSGRFGGIAATVTDIARQCAVVGRLSMPCYPTTNGARVGGIAAYATKIEDCIFTGILRAYDYSYNKTNTFVGGICASQETIINNVLFAPEDFQTDVARFFIGSIGPTYTEFTVSNAYYNSSFAMSNEKYGTPVSGDYLTSGMKLEGFSTDIWEFKAGSYPQLKNLKEHFRVSIPVENGRISLRVAEGESATINIAAERGWKLRALYVDYLDCTDRLVNNSFTFHQVTANHVVNAIFESEPTSVRAAVKKEEPSMKIEDKGVVSLNNLPQQCRIEVYDLQGKLIKSLTASNNYKLHLNAGCWIVKMGNKSFKLKL